MPPDTAEVSDQHGLYSTHSRSTACTTDAVRSLKASMRGIRAACRAAARQRDRVLLASAWCGPPPGLHEEAGCLDYGAVLVLEDTPIPKSDCSFDVQVAPTRAIVDEALVLQDLPAVSSEASEALQFRGSCSGLQPSPASIDCIKTIAISDGEDEREHPSSLDAYDLEDCEWQESVVQEQRATFAAFQQQFFLASRDVEQDVTQDGRLVDSKRMVQISMTAARHCARLAAHIDASNDDTPDASLPLLYIPCAQDVLQLVVFFLGEFGHWNFSDVLDAQEVEHLRDWWHRELSTSPWAPQWRDKPSRGYEVTEALEWLQVMRVPSMVRDLVRHVEAHGAHSFDKDPSAKLLASVVGPCQGILATGIVDGLPMDSQASVCIIGDIALCLQARELALPYLHVSGCRQPTRHECAAAKVMFRTFDCVLICPCLLSLVPDVLWQYERRCWDIADERDELEPLVGTLRASYASSSQEQLEKWAFLKQQPFLADCDRDA